MSDFILTEGNKALFIPTFGTAIVVVRPGVLSGSGPAKINGKKMCVLGDESKLSVPGCTYMAGPYVIPGIGTLKIERLANDQKATKTKTGGKVVLLKGSNFTAKFEVQSPALQPVVSPPGPPIPDNSRSYTGFGMFIPGNTKMKGT